MFMFDVSLDMEFLCKYIFNWCLGGYCNMNIFKCLREKYGFYYGDFKGVFKGLIFKKRDL